MIDLRGVQHDFPRFSLGPISLQVDRGAFFALMGPTGSGKTLLLESLAGLLVPHSGKIFLSGNDITATPPEKRNVGLVYQDHALFPHMNVLENIMFGQRYHVSTVSDGEAYAYELMKMLDIAKHAKRSPRHLSGGEKQRVALARALAFRPDIVLLDEPLSALDPHFREGLRRHLKEVHQNTETTFFMVTHDFVDALALADSAAVIHEGKILQSGSTLDIFHRPATPFIAEFVGMKNTVPACYSHGLCSAGAVSFSLTESYGSPSSTGYMALRPEDMHLSAVNDFPAHWVVLTGEIVSVSRSGFSWFAEVSCGSLTVTAHLEQRQALNGMGKAGVAVTLGFDPAVVHHIFP